MASSFASNAGSRFSGAVMSAVSSTVSVPSDDEGPVPSQLTPALMHGARFMYCLPNFQNPTGRRIPTERRTELAVIPADGEFTDLGIGGFAAAAVEELVATARGADPESATDAQAALGLLLRLTDRGAA